jgi:hypothetical protein
MNTATPKNIAAWSLGVVLSFATADALAGAQCQANQDGNTWNLVCAADESGEAGDEFQCDYTLSVATDQSTEPDVIEATGSVGRGESGIIIWSAIQDGGANITSVDVQDGSCSQ